MTEHFEDGQKVRIKDTGEQVTIDGWALSKGPWGKQSRYTYTIIENPATFYFHHELENVEEDVR
jgi:hypothetical protein